MLNNINIKDMSIAGPHQSHNIPQQVSLNGRLETNQKSYSLSNCCFAKGLIFN